MDLFCILSDFRDQIDGFESFCSEALRSEDRPHPEGLSWPPVKVLSVICEMNLCSSEIIVERARIVLST